jgi:hypothetical protein
MKLSFIKKIVKVLLLIISVLLYSCQTEEDIEYIKKTKPKLRVSEALEYCKENNMNTEFCILVDMSMHSGLKRLVVWDFKKDSILNSALVSHGCGESLWYIDNTKDNPTFSNTIDSHLSSLGKYALVERSYSKWGINIKYWLKGLEESNNNAVERVIVLHGWSMIEDETTYPSGTPEGWGCPAVSNNMMQYLDDKLKGMKKPTLFWIYKY